MSLNLRQAILDNIAEHQEEEIRATILDAIQSGEEKMLPGLGVLFELAWHNAPAEQQEEMIGQIEKNLQNQ